MTSLNHVFAPISSLQGLFSEQQLYDVGNWDGTGIDSSAAANNFPNALGYVDTAITPITGLDNTTIIIGFTVYGDTNLDGQVVGTLPNGTTPGTGSDGSNVAFLGTLGQTWQTGDFNYSSDGLVNCLDYELFGLGQSTLSLAAPTQVVAVGTYQTRVDLTWAESADVQGFQIQYELADSNDWQTLQVYADTSTTDTLVGAGSPPGYTSLTLGTPGPDDGSVRDASVELPALTGDSASYDFQVRAIVNGVDSLWSTPIACASVNTSLPSETPTDGRYFQKLWMTTAT